MTRWGSVLLCALLAGACVEVPKPKSPDDLEVKDVEVSEGMELAAACTPSGIEQCFDALDNNCNGIIDEGCGVHTGILQFTIAWQEAAVDVDLQVNGPDGDLVNFNSPSEAGLIKDRDCPGRDNLCYGQNTENVYLAEGKPRRGRYRVVVRLQALNDTEGPIEVRLSARIGQRHFTSLLELEDDEEQQEFEFSL